MVPELNKILLVEDEADIQIVAKLALESVGKFTVHMCGSGSDALAELPGFDPDIILLDVMMPGMDGPDTFKAIRQLDGYAAVPIIFMTAKVMEKDREIYRSLGAAGIIAKPFDPMALSDQIREIWGQHHAR
jgi:two-component system OmpR family response regulator